jgi:hypothetical protein
MKSHIFNVNGAATGQLQYASVVDDESQRTTANIK